ncbi:hypothetical protein F9288_06390 [Sphingomonas sp. CL5.1]|uniref:hypothetical protein n=1 Tax=Sphingomonas sp. CL5.1 TaxID=2653203 RepID=UPI0015827161|nr:hypothetical protein [Sphingomonas sp. CL5.1]QKR99308.1 hypothetical protein F9288_06390 [Sphingomonas sp. CL5.1]
MLVVVNLPTAKALLHCERQILSESEVRARMCEGQGLAESEHMALGLGTVSHGNEMLSRYLLGLAKPGNLLDAWTLVD